MLDTTAMQGGPSLPEWFLFPASLIFALVAGYLILRTRGLAARYVIFASWFRYTLSSLHEYSYQEAVAGISWIALGSVLIILIGFAVLDFRRILIKPLIPVGLICSCIAVSGILNDHLGSAFEPVLRFLFFSVICVAVLQALESGGALFLKRMLYLFVPLLLYQLASIFLGVVKAGEFDGSASYIGGFYHEQQFSIVLATCVLVAALAHGASRLLRTVMTIVALMGVYWANYRTTIIGLMPLVAVQLILNVPRAFAHGQRTLVRGVVGVAALAALAIVSGAVVERFSDLRTFATQAALVLEAPESFQSDERRLLSGRIQIWSGYIHAYAAAPTVQKVVGFGPDAWIGTFPKNAHNTVLSFLYEFGILGVAALLSLWITMLYMAFRAPSNVRPALVASHLGFLIWNMATLPHWQLEGNIFYGILCGYTLAKARVAVATKQAVKRPLEMSTPVASSRYSEVHPR